MEGFRIVRCAVISQEDGGKMKRVRLFAGIILGIAICFVASGATAQTGFNLADFKTAIYNQIKATGKRDTIYKRVPAGQSCVEASDSRASTVASLVKTLQSQGKFGLLGVKVGRTSGWNPLAIVPEETRKKYIGETATGSMHTYTVAQVYDANGKVWFTIDADNYLGPIYVSEHGAVDWDADHTKLIEDVPPVIRSVNIYNPPVAVVGDTISYQVSVDAAPWISGSLRYKWMYVGGVKTLGYGDRLSLTVDRPTTYNVKAIIYHTINGKEVILASITGSTLVSPKPVVPTLPRQETAASGRRGTSRPVGQPGNPAAINTSNPVQGVFDVFKKAGDFFGK